VWLILAFLSRGRPREWHEGARVDEQQSGRL